MKWRGDGPVKLPLPPRAQVADLVRYREIPAYRIQSYLHQKYVAEGLSTRQIAAENLTSKFVVQGQLKQFGIPLRPAHKTGTQNASARYGTRRCKGKLIENLAEVRVIKAVVDMHQQGMSLRQIAKFLSQIGVPTKQRGKAWHPEMIKRILSNHSVAGEVQAQACRLSSEQNDGALANT